MAFEAYLKVKGSKQGYFKGDGKKPAHRDQIAVFGFSMGVESPRDIATGNASGKRQWGPVKIVKEWGASSPQFFQALISNENLPEVSIQFVETGQNGHERVFKTVNLLNATVQSVQHSSNVPKSRDTHELERVEFAFQKIDMTSSANNKTSKDDWNTK